MTSLKKGSKLIQLQRRNLTLFGYGVMISCCSFLVLFFIEYEGYEYSINPNFTFRHLFKYLIYCLSIAVFEEILFRYLFLKSWIKDSSKPFNSKMIKLCLISSLIFGFIHLKIELFPMLQLLITLAGIVFFYTTFLFRSIYPAIGMHFSWNFMQGVVFPFNGSGSMNESIFILKQHIALWPEGNSYVILSCLLEVLLITLLYKYSNKIGITEA